MSTATHRPATFDVASTPRTPFVRLVSVELRKLVDTRSGRWLLIVMAALILLGSAIFAWAERDGAVAFFDFTSVAGGVTGFLLPVLAILAVTSEWSQRTNMTTFTLEPHRERVVAAKLVAAVVAAVLSIAVAVVIGAVMSGFAALLGADVDWDPNLEGIAAFTVAQVLGLLVGFALGTLLLNTPAAIVVFFAYFTVIPGLLNLAGFYFDWFADVVPWVDFVSAQAPLANGFGGVEWGHLLVSGAIWFVLPLVLGITRVLRAEVK
ncbi:ABC transporter permease [Nocardioides sp. ChNu-153]|uniref:ABC transporter permease subunit n=1 Tax=unclassified Nocardioides TaxID=2615069 RepID=UPI002404A4A9|nr:MULTISPECIES: ABC transporter permease subunit [unclassified Nocardioides]MDF9716391.1 ABC transporter permease [Nocardioides sp. ChNu-99]MDN7122897.1 ABC transporter permease [Nocardioides sp. ChNu-153]